MIKFQKVFLEFLAFTTEANYDYVYLYDGYNASDHRIVRLSGSYTGALPGPYKSTQPYMFVWFTTDYSNFYTGFEARYTSTYGYY